MSSDEITLYKYVSMEHLASTLENQRLYLNDGRNFNDPFELAVTDRKTKRIEFIEGLHILSLTNSYRKKLIWSHYTNSHKGVCLTVRVPKALVYPVCYTSKRVYTDSDIDRILATGKASVKKNLQKIYTSLSREKKIAFIKDRKWEYEKEYRIVFDKEDESELICEEENWFMPVKITNIYLGVNFDKNDKKNTERIRRACERNNVKITQMELSPDKYEVRVAKK